MSDPVIAIDASPRRRSRTRKPDCATPAKIPYRGRDEALWGAKRIARHSVAEGRYFDALYGYPCVCTKWHLTRESNHNGEPNELMCSVPDSLQAWARGEPAVEQAS